MTQTILDVPGIQCSGCADAIRNSLTQLAGVASVDVEVASRKVSVTHDSQAVTVDQIVGRLDEIGFDSTVQVR